MKPKYYDHLGCKLGTSCGAGKNETETAKPADEKEAKPSAPAASATGAGAGKSIKVDRRRLVATTTSTKTTSGSGSTDATESSSSSSSSSSSNKAVVPDPPSGNAKNNSKQLHYLDEEYQVLAFGFDKWKVNTFSSPVLNTLTPLPLPPYSLILNPT